MSAVPKRFPSRIQPGERFGKLTVVKKLEWACHNSRYEARCDCGETTRPMGQALLNGRSTSCGCGRAQKNAATWEKKLGHPSARSQSKGRRYGYTLRPTTPRRTLETSPQMTSNVGDPIWRRSYPETRPPIRPGTRCRFCGEPPEEVFRNGTKADREPLYAGREDRIVTVLDDTGDPHCPCVVKWGDGFVGIAERTWLEEVPA